MQVEKLSIEFHDHDVPERVVNHLDMELAQGEILGIVGESGSGKSMTAMAVAGLLTRHDMAMEGKIVFDGKELLHADRGTLRQIQGNDIGIVFQEPMTSLNPVKRIGWQVEESLRIHMPEMGKEERYRRVIRALEDVELDDPQLVYKKYPHELSGGMRQRVMIASAMICEPKLLIADEPTTALDVTIGGVTIGAAHTLEDYDMELVADLGSVHVNNRSESTHFRQSGDAGKLSVNTSVGSVRLSY